MRVFCTKDAQKEMRSGRNFPVCGMQQAALRQVCRSDRCMFSSKIRDASL